MSAYNRQGVGPFSEPSELLIGSDGDGEVEDDDDVGGVGGGRGLLHPAMPESAPGLKLAAQEVW